MNPNTQTLHNGEPAEDTGAMKAVGVDDAANQSNAVDVTPSAGSFPINGAQGATGKNIVVKPLMDHYTVEGGGNGAVGDDVEVMDPPVYTRPNMGESSEFAVTLWKKKPGV